MIVMFSELWPGDWYAFPGCAPVALPPQGFDDTTWSECGALLVRLIAVTGQLPRGRK